MAGDSGRFENAGRKIDEHLGEPVEENVKRVIEYLNSRVVPEVRENSSKALRIAAEQLNRLAEHLERRQGGSKF